ncbi:MAG: response regulator transcription factor [Planctomycetota bacterium]
MMDKKSILVVEDEPHLAVGIQFNLEAEGYQVISVGDGPKALQAIEANPQTDLVILDLMLPGMSGYAVCEAIRAAGNDVPILILSARTLSEDRTRGFDVGANQYLSKPFELDELISRVRNLLTHYKRGAPPANSSPSAPPSERYAFGDATINFTTFEVQVAGQPVQMTSLEMKLLRYFIEHEGRVIPRGELLEKVWNLPSTIDTRAPDQFLRRLRKIFEPVPAEPRYFLTLRDSGYRFVNNEQNRASPTE